MRPSISHRLLPALLTLATILTLPSVATAAESAATGERLDWNALPSLPDSLGVASPFVGVQPSKEPADDVLIVAGGANFPIPEGRKLWDKQTFKVYHDVIHVLTRSDKNGNNKFENDEYTWLTAEQKLAKPAAYGSSVSAAGGLICIGGMAERFDADGNKTGTDTFADVTLLKWNAAGKKIEQITLPPLPQPSVNGGAVVIGDTLYVVGGQTGTGLETASKNFWALDLSLMGPDGKAKTGDFGWKPLPAYPARARALAVVVGQHNGFNPCLYIIGGRHVADEGETGTVPIPGSAWKIHNDVWEFCPAKYDASAFDTETGKYAGTGEQAEPWRQRADIVIDGKPLGMTAGTAAPVGQSHVYVISGSDGSNVAKVFGELKTTWADYDHPGFSRKILSYHTITNTWSVAGEAETMADPEIGPDRQISANAVTTPAVKWGEDIILVSGEVRPKVRSPLVWRIQVKPNTHSFGVVNITVLIVYLLAMVGVGVYFAAKQKGTDDYFRGGKKMAWWAAGCSIFATMLSSLTFTGLPSVTFSRDWTYFLGNMMIVVVAPVAIYVALPFFRQIDATSAYEYLEKRFNLAVRLFGSASFTLFHIFRMAVVMSLTGLALAVATPLTPVQSVLLMGLLCVIYCSIGGIEAVIWTDTIQTFVLFGGGILAMIMLLTGAGGEGISAAVDADKLHMINVNFDLSSAQIAFWVIILGSLGQNISSYTADQAVVQRYMTTADSKLAAKSIWTNAVLVVPASLLFFGLGTALYAYYHQRPGQLDPTITTDQIFPLFIASKMPIGVAGLIIAGVFAAAQSTVSTSMNSTATAIVTDFMRPFNVCSTDKGYLRSAQVLTVLLGVLGTLIGLIFVDPSIKSLFDSFLKVIGLFMGVLGGLFVLGVMTRRANGLGAFIGALVGAGVMFYLWKYTKVNGYFYTTSGIVTCFIVGYVASLVTPAEDKSIDGLTIYTMKKLRDVT